MISIPKEQLYHPVRVCDDCFGELEGKQRLENSLTTIRITHVKSPNSVSEEEQPSDDGDDDVTDISNTINDQQPSILNPHNNTS